jgi:hypothetical protein
MKTYRRVHRSRRQAGVRSRAHHDPSGLRIDRFLRAGLLLVLMGICMLVFQTLTNRHHADQLVPRGGQPMRGTPVEYLNARTRSPVTTEGVVPILVGCALIGFGAALERADQRFK